MASTNDIEGILIPSMSPSQPGSQPPDESTVERILRKAETPQQEQIKALPVVPRVPQPRSSTFGKGGPDLDTQQVEIQLDVGSAELPPDVDDTAFRTITFWREGFSVENGPLLRYDHPENARLLGDISKGHAPPSLLNVRPGQPVEVRVHRRLDEDYVAPSPIRAIAGQGGFGDQSNENAALRRRTGRTDEDV